MQETPDPRSSLSPRSGLRGMLDRLVGPGASGAELAFQFVFATLAAAVAIASAAARVSEWGVIHYIASALIAFDLAGGVVTTATPAGIRWHARSDLGRIHHLAFAAIHIVHLAVVAWLFRAFDLPFLALHAGLLLASAAAILAAPRYLRRPAAMALYAVTVVVVLYAFEATPGLEWFLPLFYLKLLVGYLGVCRTSLRN